MRPPGGERLASYPRSGLPHRMRHRITRLGEKSADERGGRGGGGGEVDWSRQIPLLGVSWRSFAHCPLRWQVRRMSPRSEPPRCSSASPPSALHASRTRDPLSWKCHVRHVRGSHRRSGLGAHSRRAPPRSPSAPSCRSGSSAGLPVQRPRRYHRNQVWGSVGSGRVNRRAALAKLA